MSRAEMIVQRVLDVQAVIADQASKPFLWSPGTAREILLMRILEGFHNVFHAHVPDEIDVEAADKALILVSNLDQFLFWGDPETDLEGALLCALRLLQSIASGDNKMRDLLLDPVSAIEQKKVLH